MEKQKRLSMLSGELCQRMTQLQRLHGLRVVPRCHARRSLQRHRLAPIAQPVGVLVVGDAVEPRRDRRLSAEGGKRLPCLEEGLLGQVFRLVAVPRQVAEQAEHTRVLLTNELLSGSALPCEY